MKRKIILYNSKLKQLARNLRNNSTPAEIKLWNTLSGKKFYGFDFHRQKPLLDYIVDFYCSELNLAIEIDGRYHTNGDQHNLDENRTAELLKHNIIVLRFTENEVNNDILNVMRTLETYIIPFIEQD